MNAYDRNNETKRNGSSIARRLSRLATENATRQHKAGYNYLSIFEASKA